LELAALLDHHRIGAKSRGNVALHPRDLASKSAKYSHGERRYVLEIDLGERLIQDRTDHANVSAFRLGT